MQHYLDVFEAYARDLAMVLGDDDIGPKRFERLRIDAVELVPCYRQKQCSKYQKRYIIWSHLRATRRSTHRSAERFRPTAT